MCQAAMMQLAKNHICQPTLPSCSKGQKVSWLPRTELITFPKPSSALRFTLQGTEHSHLHQLPNPEIYGSPMTSPYPPTPKISPSFVNLTSNVSFVSVCCHFYNLSSDYHHLFSCFKPATASSVGPCFPWFLSSPLSTLWPPLNGHSKSHIQPHHSLPWTFQWLPLDTNVP